MFLEGGRDVELGAAGDRDEQTGLLEAPQALVKEQLEQRVRLGEARHAHILGGLFEAEELDVAVGVRRSVVRAELVLPLELRLVAAVVYELLHHRLVVILKEPIAAASFSTTNTT